MKKVKENKNVYFYLPDPQNITLKKVHREFTFEIMGEKNGG
jgi:hypothetical protein